MNRQDLQCWCKHLDKNNGKAILDPIALVIESDASNSKWGVVCNDWRMGGGGGGGGAVVHSQGATCRAYLALKVFFFVNKRREYMFI